MRPIVLVAASGLAREAASAVVAVGGVVVGCVDDDPATWGGELVPGISIEGPIDLAAQRAGVNLLLCAGKGTTRRALAERLAALGVGTDRYATVIHPSVCVPPSCLVGGGSLLLAGTVLTADVSIGRHVVCMPSVVLTHDDEVSDFVTLCAGVVLGGSVQIGEAAYVGMAASVHQSRRIGDEATVGMGAVVLSDVAAGSCVVGAPARELTRR